MTRRKRKEAPHTPPIPERSIARRTFDAGYCPCGAWLGEVAHEDMPEHLGHLSDAEKA